MADYRAQFKKADVVVNTLNYTYGQFRVQVETKEKVFQFGDKMYPDVLCEC